MISIFTDGSSRGNPGPGGWGSVVVSDDLVVELGGGEKHTTNNRMELMAAIEGLKKSQVISRQSTVEKSQKETKIKIFSDSSYVINGITKWVYGWKMNGWKTKTKDDVVNIDLWKQLDDVVTAIGPKNIFWEYVGGHIGIVGNERCDEIATAFADNKATCTEILKLYDGHLDGYSIANILEVSHNETLLKAKKSSSSKSKSSAKAYSYVSTIDGKIEIHHSWADCEKRVKGAKGARFKKSFDAASEKAIVVEFSAY